MNAVSVFLFGLAVLGLFFWYFGADEPRRKRTVGTVLTFVVSLFCLYVFVSPRDGRLIETLTKGNQRGDEGKLFGNIPLGIDLRGGSSFMVKIDPAEGRPVTKDVQEQVRAIMEKRLNAYGTVDMAIIPQGSDRLEIQMPGVKKDDFEEVRKVIRRIAKLEFRLVNPQSENLIAKKKSPTDEIIEPGYDELPMLREDAKEEDEKQEAAAGFSKVRGRITELDGKTAFKVLSKGEGLSKVISVGDGVEFTGGKADDLTKDRYVEVLGKLKDDKFLATKVHYLPSIVVKHVPDVSGEDVSWAAPHYDNNGWVVTLRLNSKGADRMERATKDRIGQGLGIVLDGEVISAPKIRDVLRDNIQISGSFTEKQVRDLASALNNPLQNPLSIEKETAVDATAGKNTIIQGIYSGIAGLAAILIFMLIYYRIAGLIAIFGLVVNAIILFGFMSVSHSTLTMLGIAGIILTIGMGVDANVLIYERLREESNSGKGILAALHAGYERAFSAIFDGHMTSLLTAVILFWFAGGTIKGFAVSLTIGILASLFGSLLVTRTLFNWFPNLKKLSFLDLIKNRHFDFMGKAKYWIGISVVSLVVTVVALGIKRESVLGPDLRGGDKITISGHADISTENAEKAAHSVDKSAVVINKATLQGDKFLEVRTSPDQGTAVLNAIGTQAGIDLTHEANSIQIEKIGSQVGSEMLKISFWALLAGVVGILLYLTFRFEFSFSLGAIVALFHDLIFCTGAIIVSGRDLNLIQVGALLTVAGYSVTDTVVIFDRIREYFHTHKGDLKSIMNDAISSTLSRTLLTSLCTLITVIFLYFFGGPALADFAFTIVVGIVVGTYSSIFVASPIVLWWATRSGHDLRGDAIREAEARALATGGLEREVGPRRI